MSLKEALPVFEDTYNKRKMTSLVEILERAFNALRYSQRTIRAVTAASFNCAGTDEVILVDYTPTGAVTINLPLASLWQGRNLVIKDRGANASGNNITLDGGGSDTIDGAGTLVISTDSQCVIIGSDGSNWYIESIT